MAQDLRYNVTGSFYNSNNPDFAHGRLYNWATLMHKAIPTPSPSVPSGMRGICPPNWHIPSDGEWTILEISLGLPPSEASSSTFRGEHGEKVRSTSGWFNNANGTNTTGMNIYPTGYYNYASKSFMLVSLNAYYFTTTEAQPGFPFIRAFSTNRFVQRAKAYPDNGYACRCVLD